MFRTALTCFVLGWLALSSGAQRSQASSFGGREELRHQPRPNILVIMVDDLGWRDVDATIPTPSIDSLAERGVSFPRVYTAPICSASRYAFLFGAHPFREQLGFWINAFASDVSIPLSRVAFPEVISKLGYRTLMTGKWHMSTVQHLNSLGLNPYDAPRYFGFDTFRAGRIGNLSGMNTYDNWVRSDDGVTSNSTEYNTTAIRRATAEWWQATPGPKFAYAAFQAAHEPFHVPPAALLPPGYVLGSGNRGLFEAAIVALDTEIGNLLSVVDLRDTMVIFLSDNGTPPDAIAPDQEWFKVKASAYEGGINVPAMISGWGVRHGMQSDALISMTDFYATILDILDVAVPAGHAQDSVSFEPLLRDPKQAGRDWVYAQIFTPNGPDPKNFNAKAVVTPTRKLWFTDGAEAFFDLVSDPTESSPLSIFSDPTLYGELRGYMNDFEAQGAP